MGNRAVITTTNRDLACYMHWNGGRDTVEPLLEYCKLKGYRAPETDSYGWARLCQVLGNFFGGNLCVGISPYTDDESQDPGDNGIYIMENWEIVERIPPYDGFEEQVEYSRMEMLRAFDDAMPEGERLGELLDSVEVDVADVKLGDEVWLFGPNGRWEHYPVVGFGQPSTNKIAMWVDMPDGKKEVTYPNLPYVKRYDHDGDYSWNCNNYVRGGKARIMPRG